MSVARGQSAFGFGALGWMVTWGLAAAVGAALYAVTVWLSYASYKDAIANAPLQHLNSMSKTMASDPSVSALIAQKFGVEDKKAVEWLAAALSEQGGKPLGSVSILDIISSMFLGTRACTDCSAECRARFASALTRLLGGWPGETRSDYAVVTFAAEAYRPKGKTPAEACAAVTKEADAGFSATGVIIRSPPVAAPDLASLLLGPESCDNPNAADIDKCRLLTRLFQDIIDSAGVRELRSLSVNLFFGWERLFVWILAAAASIVCVWHWRMRLPLDAEADKIAAAVDQSLADGTVSPDAIVAAIIQQRPDWNEQSILTANPLADLVRAISFETQANAQSGGLESTAKLHLEAIDSDRMSIDSMIAMFPVVGFVATLLGLIEALAAANRIATTTGDQRGAAILDVTSVLSSCFSTTFLALVCMSIFAVVNMIQGRKERSLIHDMEIRFARLIAAINEQNRQMELQHQENENQTEARRIQRAADAARRQAEDLEEEAQLLRKRSNALSRSVEVVRQEAVSPPKPAIKGAAE